MVRAFGHQNSMQKARSFHFRRMFEKPGRQIHNFIFDDRDDEDSGDDKKCSSRFDSTESENPMEIQQIGCVMNSDNSSAACLGGEEGGVKTGSPPPKQPPSEVDMIKERFSKLLLGEDMSASVFGEQSKLAPMSIERKTRWRREVEWLLSVTDHIVEFAPSRQIAKDGTSMEIMTTRQRNDLLMNIPALRKLDAMLIDTLDEFKEENEFWYVSANDDQSEGNNTKRKSEKWWLPTVKVPPDGLSEEARKWMHFQKDSVNQVLKAAMAINAQVLSEMEIPENYMESLPKNGRESLGDSIYKSLTEEYFDPGQLISNLDLSTEHKVLDLKNKIEASIVIWKRKMHNKDSKSTWGSAVSLEKRELLEDRAETILLTIKQRFPGLPQSSLDISKIQYNKDVGQSILESYSRVIESLAFTVLSRIEDVLYADSLTQNPQLAACSRRLSMDSLPLAEEKSPSSVEEMDNLNSTETPCSMTLSDFMGWNSSFRAGDAMKNNCTGDLEDDDKENDDKSMRKSPNFATPKKVCYLEKIECMNSIKSPIARH